MRAALIGPVPPELGGVTPGGVATHQVHLARGLVELGVDAPLLASNASVRAPGPARLPAAAGLPPVTRVLRAGSRPLAYGAAVGPLTLLRYATHLGLRPPRGSRREALEDLLAYRGFLAATQPNVVHVQHPLDRATLVRRVQRTEHWTLPLVVTAHSLFGEHDDDTIARVMGPNLRAADRVIAVSPHVAEQALALGVRDTHLRVIRSGVDTTRFAPRDRAPARQALQLDPTLPLLLFVGNLEPRKQVDVLLRALAQVRQTQPDVVLVVVGTGDNAGELDQTARLHALRAELGLGDSVWFAGRLSETALRDAYAAADVFVLPSSSEAQGIVALEAMACALPVVATAVGGLRETIQDGLTGRLVPSGDDAALAAALGELLADPARRRAIGQAARAHVEAEFAWSRAARQTLSVYRELAPGA
jgi:glycosyltransferase involved in cell wall biosynthesis